MPEANAPSLGIIVPCYNEEEVLPFTAERLKEVINHLKKERKVSEKSYVVFVDDGSADRTWEIIKDLSTSDPETFKGIKLSRNFGHQKALLAGLLTTDFDIYITIDADLQDPPETIYKMIEEFYKGSHVVYGVRENREQDSLFKRATARFFYKLMKFMGVDIVYDHADFRLMSREVVENLKKYREVNLFLRGLIPTIGFPSSIVYYRREKRAHGTTKYPLKKMISFALDGITSFSAFPLRVITLLGLIIFIASLGLSLWVLILKLMGRTIPGWASIVLPVYLLGGLNILFTGILGEYVSKIYSEVKSRPRFIIEEKIL